MAKVVPGIFEILKMWKNANLVLGLLVLGKIDPLESFGKLHFSPLNFEGFSKMVLVITISKPDPCLLNPKQTLIHPKPLAQLLPKPTRPKIP